MNLSIAYYNGDSFYKCFDVYWWLMKTIVKKDFGISILKQKSILNENVCRGLRMSYQINHTASHYTLYNT